MLKNIVSRFLKEDLSHPLASDGGVDGILATIPRSIPERTLFDIDHWLAESEHVADKLSPARLMQSVTLLDNEATPVVAECLDRYFDPHCRDHLAEQYWQTLLEHCRVAAAAYLRFLQLFLKSVVELNSADRRLMAPATLRAMYWLMREKVLLRIRYRSPDAAWWRSVHDLLARAHACGVAGVKLPPFAGAAEESTVWQEYTEGLYFDLAPVGSLSPENLETLDRILRLVGPSFMLKAGSPSPDGYSIDLTGDSGPTKPKPGAGEGPQWRHLNPATAYGHLLRLASQLKTEKAIPKELEGVPTSLEDTEALLRTLILHWSKQPPKRRGQREPRHDELLVVHGFALARRMLACSDFARSGRSLEYDSDLTKARRDQLEAHFTVAEHHQAQTAQAETAMSPLAVLRKLELSGDRAMMEKWALADISGTGLGAILPHLRGVHRVGALVGFRFANEVDWRLGIVRRIGQDNQGRAGVGLETLLNGPAVCAQAKPANPDGKTAWHEIEGSGLGYLDALLVSPACDELVLPAGAFAPNLPVSLRVAGKDREIVLIECVDSGKDFVRVRFRLVES